MSTNKNISYKQLEQILNKKKRVILSTHVNPDGDGLGTEMAFYHYLSNKGIDCRIINLSVTPTKFYFLDPDKKIFIYTNDLDKWILGSDLLIAFDIGDYTRLNELGEIVKGKLPVLCFDHHPLLHEELYTYTMVDVKSPATGFSFWKYLKEIEYSDKLPLSIANSLYVALICDTGSFKYEGTTSETHLMAANLIDSGVDTPDIQRRIYEKNKLSHVLLLGYVITHLQFDVNKKFVWAFIDDNLLKKLNATSDDLDGITDYMRSVITVEVAFLIRTINSKDIKINFRSKGKIIINDIAGAFGGGGHKFAAGAYVKGGNPEKIKNIILEKLNKKVK